MPTSTPARSDSQSSLPTLAALMLGVGAGGVLATQIRINASLGEQLGSSLLAAFFSFGSGLAILLILLLIRPATRQGLRRLQTQRLAPWNYLSGVIGAFSVTTFIVVVPTIGVAVFAVAAVSGQILGGLIVDKMGISPAGRRAITTPRVMGATIAIAGMGVTQLDKPLGEIAVGLIGLAFAVNVAVAGQMALNGRLIKAARDAIAATTVHTGIAAVTTGVLFSVAIMGGRIAVASWPTQWWLYCGGAIGVVFVATLTICARSLDVFRVALTTNGGQLIGALFIDGLVPGGPGINLLLIVGASLTFLAVAVASKSQNAALSTAEHK